MVLISQGNSTNTKNSPVYTNRAVLNSTILDDRIGDGVMNRGSLAVNGDNHQVVQTSGRANGVSRCLDY